MIEPSGYFEPQDLEDLLNGAVFLASGGGGARINGEKLLAEILKFSDRVPYIDPERTNPEQFGTVLAAMGAPEKFISSGFTKAPLRSLTLLEEAKQKGFPGSEPMSDYHFSFTVPVETGVIAHMMSMMVTVQKEIVVVNGDGGGRAFPSLAMSTFACHKDKVPVAPSALVTEAAVSEGGTEVILDLIDPSVVDDLSRALLSTTEFNDVASLASFAMTGGELLQTVTIPHTLTKARDVGRLLRESSEPVEAILKNLGGYLLATGTVMDIQQQTRGGFDFGTVVIEDRGGNITYVLNQNENAIAWSSHKSHPIALAPDPICYLSLGGKGLSNADIEKGQELALIGFTADEQLRVPYFINLFKDVYEKVFGYHGPYVPIEQLQQD